MSYKTGLDISLFTLGPPDAQSTFLANLKAVKIRAENHVVDARGIADPFQFNQVVKQAQSLDFTVMLGRGDPYDPLRRLTNLDVTIWSFGTSDYVGQVQGGEIGISVPVVDRSALRNLERYPVPVGGVEVEIKTQLLVIDSAVFTEQLLVSPISGFHMMVGVMYGGSAISAPMLFKAAHHKMERGELQLEEVILQARGTPTASGVPSLLGAVMTGTVMFGFELQTGAGHYGTSVAEGTHPAQYGVITSLNVKFQAGTVVEMTGTMEIQSQMLVE